MTQADPAQIALRTLAGGEFKRARDLYGQLVESDPEDLEYLCGLYSSGYWDNRSELMDRQKSGRMLAGYLMQEWDRFEHLATERNYGGCLTFRAVMQGVLGRAAEEFRTAFQEESGAVVDTEMLVELGKCLIRIEDYKNAAEILHYARRLHEPNASLCFLK